MESECIHVQIAMCVFACTRMRVSIWSGEEPWGLALGYIKLGTHVWGQSCWKGWVSTVGQGWCSVTLFVLSETAWLGHRAGPASGFVAPAEG